MKNSFFRTHRVSIVLVVVAVVQLVYGVYFAMHDSATIDEVAHIADGYGLVVHQDNRLNPEHPPLLKTLAGLVVVAQVQNDIVDTKSWIDSNQWGAGRELLYWQDNDADRILFLGRIPTILFTVAWTMLMFFVARTFFSERTSWVVYSLAVLYPDVLGHGHFITTDMAATFGYTLAMFVYLRYLKHRTPRALLLAIFALAIAQLCKFSSVLLYIMFPILSILWSTMIDRKRFFRSCIRALKELAIMTPLSLLIIWLFYIPVTLQMTTETMHFLVNRNLSWIDGSLFWLRDLILGMSTVPILRGLADYFLGVAMVLIRVQGGNATFIWGHLDASGIWWFFPVAWLVKTPIGIILLFFTGTIAALRLRVKKEFLVFVFVPLLIYWIFTLKGSLNLGTRHLLPTVPFVLLIVGYGWEVLWKRGVKHQIFLGACVAWAIVSSAINAPHAMAYMNEVSLFKPRQEILLDSSLDWGQDLKRLAVYVKENSIEDISVDYFGGGDFYREIPHATQWHSEYGPTTGYLAVSASFIPASRLYGEKEGKWSYDWLSELKPVAIIGHSILVYNITPQDLVDHPPISPYPFGNFQGAQQ